jgi:hypothetical protein
MTGQGIDWGYYAKITQNDSGNNGSIDDYGDGMLVYVDGRILATTGYYVASDERIKTNILDISDNEALTKFRLLKPKTYNYKDTIGRTNQKVFGFLAQDVREVIPEAVSLQTEVL